MNATDPDCPAGWNPWFDGQQWARPSVPHLRRLMRRVFTHRDEAAAKGLAARAHLLGRFTPEVLAARVHEQVARIQAKLARDRSVARTLGRPRGATLGQQPAWGLPAGGAVIPTTPHTGGAGHSAGAAAAAAHRQHQHSGAVGEGWRDHMATLVEAARQSGFSHADGGGEAVVDTKSMMLGEVLDVLEGRPQPRTRMTAPGRAAHGGSGAATALMVPWPGAGGGGAGGRSRGGRSGVEKQESAAGSTKPLAVEEEEVEDAEEDDSIVLNYD